MFLGKKIGLKTLSGVMGIALVSLLFGCSNLNVSIDETESLDVTEARVVSTYDTSLSGYYYIKNAYSGLYLDVNNGATDNGTNIQQWAYNGSTAQQFNLVSVGNGYYAIKTVCSNSAKALDVWGRSSSDGTNIATYSYSGGSNQQFKFVKQSDGSYAILTRISGDNSCLDDYNWSKSNGGNVCQWNYWGGACQKWVLTKVSSSSSSSSSTTTTTTSTVSSINFAKNLKAGWNLGNTLDAYSDDTSNQWCQGLYAEACWGSPYTTQTMIKSIKSAGFTTIRIPITWHTHVDSSYNIDSEWMNRVKTVVDWAYNEGLYVIINVHHDNITASAMNSGTAGYVLNSSYKTKSNAYLKAVWTQIATTFKGYNDHLIFEVLNEPRNVGGSDEWYLSSDSTAKSYNSLITAYEQTCVDAIRATGGNNASRFLMCPAYDGSYSYLGTYSLPTDSASDKLLISYHAYNPYNFAMYSSSGWDTTFDSNDKSELTSLFSTARSRFPNVGIVIGETSASNKNNLSDREAWATYYFGTAYSSYNCAVILWDNGQADADLYSGEQHGYFNRSANTWYFPSIVRNAIKAAGGTPGI